MNDSFDTIRITKNPSLTRLGANIRTIKFEDDGSQSVYPGGEGAIFKTNEPQYCREDLTKQEPLILNPWTGVGAHYTEGNTKQATRREFNENKKINPPPRSDYGR